MGHRQDIDEEELKILSPVTGTQCKGKENTASGTTGTKRKRGRPRKTMVNEGSTKVAVVEEGSAKVTGPEQGTPKPYGAASRKTGQPSRRTSGTASTVVDDFSTESITNLITNKRKKNPGKFVSSPYKAN